MALNNTRKTAFMNTKKQIKLITKKIEQDALAKINRAITCGAISDESEFLSSNELLARALIEEVAEDYKIKTKEFRKEADNLKKFL